MEPDTIGHKAEQHIGAAQRQQFAHEPAVLVVEDAFERFIFQPSGVRYEGRDIDIHPTIAPAGWLT